jgi:hypothetical protein
MSSSFTWWLKQLTSHSSHRVHTVPDVWEDFWQHAKGYHMGCVDFGIFCHMTVKQDFRKLRIVLKRIGKSRLQIWCQERRGFPILLKSASRTAKACRLLCESKVITVPLLGA